MARQFPLFPIEKFPIDKFPINRFPIDKFPVEKFLQRFGINFAFLPSLDFSLDIVTANLSGGDAGLSILLNEGAGGFSRSDYTLGDISEPLGVSLGDLDSDGNTDIVVANGGSVSVLLSDGSGGFEQSDIDLSIFILRESLLGDLDNDGDLDVVTAVSIERRISVLLNDGAGSFSTPNGYYINVGSDVLGNHWKTHPDHGTMTL